MQCWAHLMTMLRPLKRLWGTGTRLATHGIAIPGNECLSAVILHIAEHSIQTCEEVKTRIDGNTPWVLQTKRTSYIRLKIRDSLVVVQAINYINFNIWAIEAAQMAGAVDQYARLLSSSTLAKFPS